MTPGLYSAQSSWLELLYPVVEVCRCFLPEVVWIVVVRDLYIAQSLLPCLCVVQFGGIDLVEAVWHNYL